MQNGITLQTIVHEPGRPNHVWDYLVLAILIGLFGFVYFFIAFSTTLKIEAFLIFVLLYLLWGMIHHQREQTLTWRVVADYCSFSAFLGVIVMLLLVVM